MSQNPGVGSASGTQIVSTKTPLTASSPTFATVGTTSAQILASNASRKGCSVQNNSATASVYLAFGANAAVVGSGIFLAPYGTYTMDEYLYVTSSINAIASAVGTNVTLQEFT